jgi:NTF2 fold immunity protein
MKTRSLLGSALLFSVVAVCQDQPGYAPPVGFVPDSRTAVAIAEAVLIPVYGKKQIESEEPFSAALQGQVWTVGGTLRCPDGKGGVTTQCDGGVAVVRISKSDARILFMMHGK